MLYSIKTTANLFFLFATFFVSQNIFSQTQSNEYRVKKIFNLQINDSDFKKGTVFLTLDTTNAEDLFAPSNFIEVNCPDTIIQCFNGFMQSICPDGTYYHYRELINSPFYQSALILGFFVNTADATYVFQIWTDKDNTDKIEGLTVAKHPKVEKYE
jgi:hypothetical protein